MDPTTSPRYGGGAGGGRGRSDRTTSPRGAGGERAAPLQPSAAPRPRCGHRYRDNGAGAGGARRNGAGRGFFVLLRRSPPARRRLPGAVRRGGAGTARGRAERRRGGGGGQPGSPARRAVGTGRMGRGEVPRPCLSVAAQGRSAGRGSTFRAHEVELPARCREQHALSPLFVSPLLAAPISPPFPSPSVCLSLPNCPPVSRSVGPLPLSGLPVPPALRCRARRSAVSMDALGDRTNERSLKRERDEREDWLLLTAQRRDARLSAASSSGF